MGSFLGFFTKLGGIEANVVENVREDCLLLHYYTSEVAGGGNVTSVHTSAVTKPTRFMGEYP